VSSPGPKIINLNDEVSKGGELTQAKGWAEVRSINADTLFRGLMVLVIAGIFIGLNYGVFNLVSSAFDKDIALMTAAGSNYKPSDRVITTNVFVSLVGATVVQVGVAAITIVSYLFPKRP
jgi:hypothetical protein